MNLNKIKMTMATGMLAASMILPGMTAFAVPAHSVTDNGTNNIITKTIQTPEGVSFSNESFTYEFTQDGYEGTGENKTFKGNTSDSGVTANKKEAQIQTVTINGMSNGTTKAKDANNKDLDYCTTSKSGSVDLSALDEAGVYTYTVKETARSASQDANGVTNANGTTWKYDVRTYKLRVYVTNELDSNGNVKYGQDGKAVLVKKMTIVDATETANVDGKKVASAEFINKMTKRGGSNDNTDGKDDSNTPDPTKDQASLVIEKQVSNPTYEKDGQEYTFTVTFAENSLNTAIGANNTYEYYVVDKSGGRSNTAQTVTNGETIKLKNGEKAEFYKISAGTKVSVAESDVTNLNSVSATVTSNGAAGTKTALTKENDKYSTTQFLIGESTNSAVFENTYKSVTETGVVTNIAPYITLVVVAVAAVAAYMGIKNRIAR